MFPISRNRRLRRLPALRDMVRETRLTTSSLILPLFVTHGRKIRRPIKSMPGQFQLSVDELVREAVKARGLGIQSVLLFGLPKVKDARGSEAYAKNGIVQQAIRALKKEVPDLVVMADLCFCEYTNHGHCGVLKKRGSHADVVNDDTLKLIRLTARAQAEAGADFIAPSGMMDGAVAAVRDGLDTAGFTETAILGYSAKYASAFYGPFREAADSAPQFGDRRAYQMDPANTREALREVREDIAEGADLVMVKPALAYLDVIAAVRQTTQTPVVAYNVSGEYAMIKAAEANGWLGAKGRPTVALEVLTSIRRAGADLIITYHALEVAPVLGS